MSRWMRFPIGVAALLAGSALATALIGARAARRVPVDGTIATIDGAELHYVDIGSRPAIVMIHGLGGQLRNFSYALAARLSDRYRVVMVDRPGAGWSRAASGTVPTIAGQAAAVAALIAHLGLDRPLVVGHSLGGAVALALALDRPDAIAGLALVAPLTRPPRELPRLAQGRLARSRLVRALLVRTIAVPLLMLVSGRRRALVFAPETMPAGFEVAGGMVTLHRAPVLAAAIADVAGLVDGMRALAARSATLATPVAILFGRGDRVLDFAEQSGGVPGARVTLCEGGHMLPVTQPDLVARWIADVYARQGEDDG